MRHCVTEEAQVVQGWVQAVQAVAEVRAKPRSQVRQAVELRQDWQLDTAFLQ